ncbi:MAG: hypothetical protein ACOX68_03310 [Candidatus Limivicinus sp.]
MSPKTYIMWVDMAGRRISLSYTEGFVEMRFDSENLYTNALLSFMGKGYLVS